MINLLSSFVLLFTVWGLSVIEIRNLNSIFTPFTVMAWPLVIISIIVNTLAVRLDFFPVTARVNYFILLNLFLIWIVGFLFLKFSKRPVQYPNYRNVFVNYRSFRPLLITLSWVVILIIINKVVSILTATGWWYLGSQEFENEMLTGFAAHAMQLGKVLLILYLLILWKSKKSWVDYSTIIMLIFVVVIFKVKYHIVWIILIVFFIKNVFLSPKLQIKKILNISLAVVIVFIFNYLIMFYALTDFSITNKNMWQFIFTWLFSYLFAGPILLNSWMNFPFTKPWWTPFIVFINLKNVITGNPERISTVHLVNPGFSFVAPDIFGNVGTSFGVYYLIGGFIFTLLTTIIFALFSYIFYYKSLNSNNPNLIFLSAFFLTFGTLSFFVQYFTLTSFYEMLFYYILLITIFGLINKSKQFKLTHGST